MTPNNEKDDGLEELAKTDPDTREFLDLLAEMDEKDAVAPIERVYTLEEKLKIIAEWENGTGKY